LIPNDNLVGFLLLNFYSNYNTKRILIRYRSLHILILHIGDDMKSITQFTISHFYPIEQTIVIKIPNYIRFRIKGRNRPIHNFFESFTKIYLTHS